VFELEGLQSSDGTQLCVDKVVATKESVVPGGSAVYLDVGCDVPGVEISPSIVTENGEIDVRLNQICLCHRILACLLPGLRSDEMMNRFSSRRLNL